MNLFRELLDQPLAHRLGWALVHSLWQGAVAAGLFGLLRSVLRRHSANARYLAGCLMLFLLALAPIVTLCLLHPRADGSAGSGLDRVQASGSELILNLPLPTLSMGMHSTGAVRRALEILELLLPWLVAAWTFGVFLFSLRLLHGCWQLKRLRSDGTTALDPVWMETLNDLRCRLNISRPVRLLKSGLVEAPTVLGWLRPLILLPASTVTGLSPAQLEAILAHELAHVHRYDYLVNACQIVVETLMFYHPAVWWISRCIREERELCCDDLVLRVCADRVVYASALATLEELRAESPQLVFAASGGALLQRIRRLLGSTGADRPATAREVCGLALLGIGLILVICGICLLLVRPSYQAVARIKVNRDTTAQLTSSDGKVSLNIGDPYFFKTEIAVMNSEGVLGQVARDLKLGQLWGGRLAGGGPLSDQQTLAVLRLRLDLRSVEDANLIEIRFSGDRPDEAAEIANAVAAAYYKHRLEQRQRTSRTGIEALEDRFKRQELEIEQAQQKVSALREKLQIPDALAMSDAPTMLMSVETLRKLEAQRIESKSEIIRQEVMLTSLKQLSAEQLIQTIPTAVQDSHINTLLEQLSMVEQNLVVGRHEFGEEHPTIKKLMSQVANLKQKINDRVTGIMFALAGKVAASRASLEALEAEEQSAKTNDIAKAKESLPYYDAKQQLDQLKRFAQMLNMKIAAENIDAELPKSTMVEIVDQAVAPIRPASPNRYRGASCSVLGLLLALVGMVMVKSAARLRPPAPRSLGP